MSDENERSVASAGSVEPVAWSIQWHGENRPDSHWTFEDKHTAEICLAGCRSKGVVVPLYRSPTLTDEEREAVIWAAHAAKYWAMYSENQAERELFAKRGEALRWLAEKHKCD